MSNSDIGWTSEVLRKKESEDRKAVGELYDKMLFNKDLTVSCLNHDSSDVQRVALSFLEHRWPATPATEKVIREYLESSHCDLHVDAMGTLAIIICKVRGTKVSATLAEFVKDPKLSDANRATLYSQLKLAFGSKRVQMETLKHGPATVLALNDVDHDVLEHCVDNDQTSRLIIDRYPDHTVT